MPPHFMFPSPSHPMAEAEAWLGCQEAEGAAAWGSGSQGSIGWHATRSTGFLDSLPACFPLKLSMESTCSCEMFQSCKISIFHQRSVPPENFQPALINQGIFSISHRGAAEGRWVFISETMSHASHSTAMDIPRAVCHSSQGVTTGGV